MSSAEYDIRRLLLQMADSPSQTKSVTPLQRRRGCIFTGLLLVAWGIIVVTCRWLHTSFWLFWLLWLAANALMLVLGRRWIHSDEQDT